MQLLTANNTTTHATADGLCCLPCRISQIFLQASCSCQLNYTDYLFLEVVLKTSMVDAESRQFIQRVRHGIRRGWIQLISSEED